MNHARDLRDSAHLKRFYEVGMAFGAILEVECLLENPQKCEVYQWYLARLRCRSARPNDFQDGRDLAMNLVLAAVPTTPSFRLPEGGDAVALPQRNVLLSIESRNFRGRQAFTLPLMLPNEPLQVFRHSSTSCERLPEHLKSRPAHCAVVSHRGDDRVTSVKFTIGYIQVLSVVDGDTAHHCAAVSRACLEMRNMYECIVHPYVKHSTLAEIMIALPVGRAFGDWKTTIHEGEMLIVRYRTGFDEFSNGRFDFR